jgi:Flp pilus assembly protein TadD, contains TPR repeats
VRQNLGLVVGLQGRFAEAESIVKADLPPDEAASNVAYLKQMLKPQGQSARRSDAGGVSQPSGLSGATKSKPSSPAKASDPVIAGVHWSPGQAGPRQS